MTYFDQFIIFLQLEISKYSFNSIFTLNLLFRFERLRLVLTPKEEKKPTSMREFPHRHRFALRKV